MAMTTPTGGTPAAWLEDPTHHYQYRYWDGSAWTDQVASNGTVSTDALSANGTSDPRVALYDRLQQALSTYDQLLQDFQAQRIDEATFQRQAFQTGLVTFDDEAWILDLPNHKWHRYDGLELIDVVLPTDNGSEG